jgi:hypothetical protein
MQTSRRLHPFVTFAVHPSAREAPILQRVPSPPPPVPESLSARLPVVPFSPDAPVRRNAIVKKGERLRLLPAIALIALCLAPASALAASGTPVSAEDLQALREEFQQQMSDLRQENQDLKVRLRSFEEARTDQARRLDEIELSVEEAESLTAGYDEGFYIRSADDRFRLTLTGFVQVQSNWYEHNSIPKRWVEQNNVPTPDNQVFNEGLQGVNRDDSFFVRRLRLIIRGHVFSENVKYNVELGWDTGQEALRDAYIDYKWRDWAQVRLGQFKPPFSMESQESDSITETIERAAIVDVLGMGRRTGVKFFGNVLDGRLSYHLMVANRAGFGSEGQNAPDNNDGKAFIGELITQPFKLSENKWLQGLELMGAVATGTNVPSATSGLTLKDIASISGGRNPVTMTIPYIGGRQTMYNMGISWVIDRFRLKGEYMYARVTRRDIPDTSKYPFGALNFHPLTVSGGYLQLSYLLYNGENHKVMPVLKYETMQVRGDSRVMDDFVTVSGPVLVPARVVTDDYSNDFQALTVGVQWFINPKFKIMANYVFEWMGEDLIGPTRLRRGENTNQNVVMIRTQLKF